LLKGFVKRIFDIVILLPVVTILLPVFVVIAIAIKLSSKGPVIFKQERAGKERFLKKIKPALAVSCAISMSLLKRYCILIRTETCWQRWERIHAGSQKKNLTEIN
jgi:hypothetical protein